MIVQVMHAGLKAGDEVKAVHMPDDPRPVSPCTTGIVTKVRNGGTPFMQVSVDWENGRRLMLVGEDMVEI